MEKNNFLKEGTEKKILIVDDDPVSLKILEKILLSEGYWVAKAINGKEALDIANDFKPDLIVLDIVMPVMDGTVSFERLQTNPKTKNIPVLFLTSLISKKEEMGKFAADRCFLAKPVEKDKLLKEIERCLGKSRNQDLGCEEPKLILGIKKSRHQKLMQSINDMGIDYRKRRG